MNTTRCAVTVLLVALGCSGSSPDASGSGGRAGNLGSGGTATGGGGAAAPSSGAAGTHEVATGGAGGSIVVAGASGHGAGGSGGIAGSGGAAGSSLGGGGIAGPPQGPRAAIPAGASGEPARLQAPTSIFDGKTLSGWVQGSPMLWSVVNGALDGKGTTGGQILMTQSDYGDFRIVVSSNMVAVGGTGHLGICFWGGRTPVGQYNNCKLIIPPGAYTWDYSLGGGLKGVTTTGKATTNATWNTTEILCFLAKGFCRVAINGTAVLTYQEPNLKSIKAGPIGLQIHAGTNEEVQYKDVFVDPAPTEDKLLTLK